jgi:hypothetical protein
MSSLLSRNYRELGDGESGAAILLCEASHVMGLGNFEGVIRVSVS